MATQISLSYKYTMLKGACFAVTVVSFSLINKGISHLSVTANTVNLHIRDISAASKKATAACICSVEQDELLQFYLSECLKCLKI